MLYARGDPRMTVCKTFEDSECGRPSASCSNRHDLLDAKIIEALFERRVGFATISYVSAKDSGLCWKTCVIREREDDVTSLCQSLPDVMRAFANISSKDDDEPSTISVSHIICIHPQCGLTVNIWRSMFLPRLKSTYCKTQLPAVLARRCS